MPREFEFEYEDRFSDNDINDLMEVDDYGFPADFDPELAFMEDDDLSWLDDYNDIFGDDFDEDEGF